MAGDARRYIGVDVGGTKILALIVDRDGAVVGRGKEETVSGGPPLAEQIAAVVDAALADAQVPPADIAGIGLAVPGVVDSQTGRFVKAPNLEIDDPELARRVRERYDLPVSIGNDVNVGTLAEMWLGAGRGVQSVVGIFVGTGIGGGVVIDGRLRTGPEDLAGEIGHMTLMIDGPKCGCGGSGCFEALASRTAIERDIRVEMNAGRPSKVELGGDTDRIRSGALRKALKAGDPVVTDVLTRAAHYLAQGILTIRHLIDPDVVILGGGVVEACGAFLLPLIEQEVRADPMAGSRDVLRLVPSALGDDAVALGAAALLLADLGEADAAVEDAVEDADAIGSGPRIDRVEFGMVTVDGEELAHDVHIRANGKVRRRKKARLREQYGTSHLVDAEELAGVCKGSPEVVIIGRGFQSMLRLTEDARTFLEAADFDCRMLPTPEAVEAYNAATGRKALLLHVTC